MALPTTEPSSAPESGSPLPAALTSCGVSQEHVFILELARKHGLSACDDACLETAWCRGDVLATLDRALASASVAESIVVVPQAAPAACSHRSELFVTDDCRVGIHLRRMLATVGRKVHLFGEVEALDELG